MADDKGPDMENRDPNDLNSHIKVRLFRIRRLISLICTRGCYLSQLRLGFP